MTHYPLYRQSDSHCQEEDSAPPEERDLLFREGWDCLTRAASSDLLRRLRPTLVLSGHTHHGCNTTHHQLQEISVSSFSWRNKKSPAFYLGYFSRDAGHTLSKCLMPNENTLFCSYVFFISLSLFSLLIK